MPGSPGGTLRLREGEGEEGIGALREGMRGHSGSRAGFDKVRVGVGRGLGVNGDSLELGREWVSSVKHKVPS